MALGGTGEGTLKLRDGSGEEAVVFGSESLREIGECRMHAGQRLQARCG